MGISLCCLKNFCRSFEQTLSALQDGVAGSEVNKLRWAGDKRLLLLLLSRGP